MKINVAQSGTVVANRYRLEEPLGHGGMGTVWRAEHSRLKLPVAVKFLDPAIAQDPEMLQRFMREAESAAAVRGAHVVQVFDCGVDAGAPYIAMELLDGESLEARLRRCKTITPAELSKIFREVASAVGHAHELGVIHRDLKPGNIFIARVGEQEITKVLDFGIAKVMPQTLVESHGARTRTGTLLGTPHYMSPEQARGSRTLDQRSDLWSLAVIAFECLTGERPFPGDAIGDVVVRICTVSPPLPSAIADVPEGFDAWFTEGVSKDPAQRFSSAREMADSLEAILVRPTVSSATRLGGFRSAASPAVATLASSPGSSPPSPTASPHSVTLDLRRATDTVTALLRATAAGRASPLSSRQRWFLLAASLSLLGTVVIAFWPHAEVATPAFGTGAPYDTDATHWAPAEPGRQPSTAGAPPPAPAEPDRQPSAADAPAQAPAPVPIPAASNVVPAAAATEGAPLQARRQRPSSRELEKRLRQSRATQLRKAGASRDSATATDSTLPVATHRAKAPERAAAPVAPHPPALNDPFAERR